MKTLTVVSLNLILLFLSSKSFSCSFPDCPEEYDSCMTYGRLHSSYCETSVSSIDPQNFTEENILIYLNEKLSLEAQKTGLKFNPKPEDVKIIDHQEINENESLENFNKILIEASLNADDIFKMKEWRSKVFKNNFANEFSLPQMNLDANNSALVFSNALVHFYRQNYQESFRLFSILSSTSHEFTREYSLYLAIRSALLESQKNWDGYAEEIAKVDQSWVMKAQNIQEQYISLFPNGKYIISAKKFSRLISRLQKNDDTYFKFLFSDFEEVNKLQISLDEKKILLDQLLTENYNRSINIESLSSRHTLHPYYWPTYANLIARIPFQNPYGTNTERKRSDLNKELEILNNAAPLFKDYPYEWVISKATLLLSLKKFQEAFDFIQSQKISSYSTMTIKAKALIALKKYAESRLILKKIGNEQLHFLSFFWEGKISNAFKNNSGLSFNESFANEFAMASSPEQQLKLLLDKDFNQKYKTIIENHFIRKSLLLKNFTIISKYKSKKINHIISDANALSKNSNNQMAKFRLAEYLGESTLKVWEYKTCNKEDPLQSFSLKQEGFVLPIDYMAEVASSIDEKTKYPFEAKLLSTLIKCFKVTNETNCFMSYYGEEYFEKYNLELRKSWFKKLHAKYSKSAFAKSTPYYY